MSEEVIRGRLHQFLLPIPYSIIFGQDPLIQEFERSPDPIKRFIFHNPPFYDEIMEFCDGSLYKFSQIYKESKELFSETDMEECFDKLSAEGVVDTDYVHQAERAVQTFPFNEYALRYLIEIHHLSVLAGRKLALPCLEYSIFALMINPSSERWRVYATEMTVRLGWWQEAIMLANPTFTMAMMTGGDPAWNYQGMAACAQAIIGLLDSHFAANRPGLPELNEPISAFERLDSTIRLFKTYAKLSARNSEDEHKDQEMANQFEEQANRLRNFAQNTGRL